MRAMLRWRVQILRGHVRWHVQMLAGQARAEFRQCCVLVWVLALGTRCYLKIGATFSSQLSCHRTLCEHEQGRHVASTATYACIRRTSDSATPSRRRDNSEPSPGDTGWRFSNVCSCCASSCGVVNVKPLLERTHQPTMSYTSDNGVNTARRTGYAEPTRRCS